MYSTRSTGKPNMPRNVSSSESKKNPSSTSKPHTRPKKRKPTFSSSVSQNPFASTGEPSMAYHVQPAGVKNLHLTIGSGFSPCEYSAGRVLSRPFVNSFISAHLHFPG